MDQKQKEKQELEEEYNNYRQKLEEIKQKKQALEQKILSEKFKEFNEKHKYVYVIVKGSPQHEVAIFESHELAKKNMPKNGFHIRQDHTEDYCDRLLLKLNQLPDLFSPLDGYYSP